MTNLKVTDLDQTDYNEYVERCNIENETPQSFGEWMDSQSAGNHTPGPWEYVDCGNEQDVYIVYQEKSNGEAIVQLANKANARLIAAAPELLEALEGVLPIVAEWFNQKPHCQDRSWLEKARAAIAKARGQ